ncbi:hypothetical protein ACOSQ2_007213 [Xanthoceras sorbifolium]
MTNPKCWEGFGSGKEKLRIGQGDILVSEGPDGPDICLSDDLKKQLCKPWANALILKNMGRHCTLSFMLSLKQKWCLAGHWQLTNLEERYFVTRFQLRAAGGSFDSGSLGHRKSVHGCPTLET